MECLRLLDRGLTVPHVADLLECNPVTVRDALHRFAGGGFDALADAPRPGRPAHTGEDLQALGTLLDASAEAGVTWTAPELCDWLEKERGVRPSAAWLTELLHREGFRWKRTRDSVRHQADPILQQAARARLEDLRTYRWRPTRARAT
ncbi:helix-turn-helix domain-containing protein [Streptomyces sp. NPDC055287]